MTGAEVADARAAAVAAAQDAFARCTQEGQSCRFLGVVRTRSTSPGFPGQAPGSWVSTGPEDVLEVFGTDHEMHRWLHDVTSDPASYEHVALFDTASRLWPGPILSRPSPHVSSWASPWVPPPRSRWAVAETREHGHGPYRRER